MDRDKAVSRLLGAVVDESEYASLGQGIYTRAQLNRGLQKGTIEGELARSVALFKGFLCDGVAALDAGAACRRGRAFRVAYTASLALGLTLFGSLSLDMKDIQSGKDPRDKTDPKFWTGIRPGRRRLDLRRPALCRTLRSWPGRAEWLSDAGIGYCRASHG